MNDRSAADLSSKGDGRFLEALIGPVPVLFAPDVDPLTWFRNADPWTRCTITGCEGAVVPETAVCLLHASPTVRADHIAEWHKAPERSLDLRGSVVGPALFADLFDSVAGRHVQLQLDFATVAGGEFEALSFGPGTSFVGAVFEDKMLFSDTRFANDVGFTGATFRESVVFSGCTFGNASSLNQVSFHQASAFRHCEFGHEASFANSVFHDWVAFSRCRFGDEALFRDARFLGSAYFNSAELGDGASFSRAHFSADAYFDAARFKADADLADITFAGAAVFTGTEFGAGASFGGTEFSETANLNGAVFGPDADFEGMLLHEGALLLDVRMGEMAAVGPIINVHPRYPVRLDRSTFATGSAIDVATKRLSCREVSLAPGTLLRIRWAEVDATGADLQAVTVAELQAEMVPLSPLPEWTRMLDPRPRVVSLTRANTAQTTLMDVDLRACRFAGVRNLDGIRLEGSTFFAPPPQRKGLLRWSQRETLAEEHEWRAGKYVGGGWHTPATRTAPLALYGPINYFGEKKYLPPEKISPRRLAALYRSLRKAREDAKDEPGAADFYYGEMEMRRHDQTRPRVERFILFFYWAMSGYGLRASRALLALAAIIGLSSALVVGFGLAPTQPGTSAAALDWIDVVWVSLEAATFRSPSSGLNEVGNRILIVVRFLGPVLLALAVLSVRGRAKR